MPPPVRTCSIEDCRNRHFGRGWCEKHYNRWRKTGDPARTATGRVYANRAPSRQPAASRPRVADSLLSYKGSHKRVRSARGRAAEHACVACAEPATEWAYSHADTQGELTEVSHIFSKTPRAIAYSPDPQFCEPMCHSCHVSADLNAAGARPQLVS